MKDSNGNNVVICDLLLELDFNAIMRVLKYYDHISIMTIETLEEAQTIAQLNIDDDLIDEIEFLLELGC
jgi:hypothetical protein